MAVIALILVLAGVAVSLIGSLWFLLVAFEESPLWGLGCLLVPFVSLIFLILHWDKAGKPFLVQLAGVLPVILGVAVMGPSA